MPVSAVRAASGLLLPATMTNMIGECIPRTTPFVAGHVKWQEGSHGAEAGCG